MISPESSNHSHDPIDQELRALLSQDERMLARLDAPHSLATTKQFILDSFANHLETFTDIDSHDVDLLDATLDIVLEAVKADLSQQTGLLVGDEVQAHGDTLAILTRPIGLEAVSHRALPLSDVSKVHGIFNDLTIIDTPHLQHLAALREADTEATFELPDIYNPLGLSLVLTDAVYIDEEGEATIIPDDQPVCIPLIYPDLQLNRIIRPQS